jgi:hypothetical protein
MFDVYLYMMNFKTTNQDIYDHGGIYEVTKDY